MNIENLINSAFSGLDSTNDNNQEAVADMLDRFGLRWTVKKSPLQLPDGKVTQFFGIERSDTRKVFATCKEGYEPFQNSELAEILHRIGDKSGYRIHSGGAFNDGGKVFLQLDTGNRIREIGQNRTTVEGYITGINSHDGSTSLRWGLVNFTICCKNLFAAAKSRLTTSVRHTASMRDKVDQFLKEVETVAAAEQSLFDQYIRLAEQPIQKEHIVNIVNIVTGVNVNQSAGEAKEKTSAYKTRETQNLLRSVNREMNQKGQTLWGLFSGVTHYTTHAMPVPKRTNGRTESKYTGGAMDVDNKAFSEILKYC